MCDKSQFTEGRADKFIKIYEELYTEIVKSLDWTKMNEQDPEKETIMKLKCTIWRNS